MLTPSRGARGEYRFTLQDLLLLRTAKSLADRVPPRRVRRALRRLRGRLREGRPLSGVRLAAVGEDVVVREGARLWHAESGQGVLDFEVPAGEAVLAPLPHPSRTAPEPSLGAQDWYELGCELEEGQPNQARDAYRRALELDPEHAAARVNLGHLLHEAGQPGLAARHYRLALLSRPGDATAAFNLGVALEDLARPGEAIEAYEQALRADPRCAEAHYNLARLHERMGRKAMAFRHLRTYRDLTEG